MFSRLVDFSCFSVFHILRNMAVALGGLPPPKSFDTIGEPESLEQRWKDFKSDIGIYLSASGVKDPAQMISLSLHLGGKELKEIYTVIPEDQKKATPEKNVYETAIGLFDSEFKLKKNIPKARQNFLQTTPKHGETINNFIQRLKLLVVNCEYTDQDDQVRDKVLFNIKDPNLRSKLLREENLTLVKLSTIVGSYHSKDAMVLGPVADGATNRVRSQKKDKADEKKCYGCGAFGHFKAECRRSKGHKCEKCGKIGHLAQCCFSKTAQSAKKQYQKGQTSKRRNMQRAVEGDSKEDLPSDSEEDLTGVFQTISRVGRLDDTVECIIDGESSLSFVVDSGAHHNTLCEADFDKLNMSLSPSNMKLYAYACKQPLALKGQCDVRIGLPGSDKSILTRFYVIHDAQVSLLSNQTAKDLGILKIDVSAVTSGNSWTSLQQEYPSAFQGLGKLKGYQLKLRVDETVAPVIQPVRRIPFSRRQKVVEKLQQLMDLDVIERVDSPSKWVNPLVVVEKKPEEGKDVGDVRICVDMRRANEAIVRERHPVPTVEQQFMW